MKKAEKQDEAPKKGVDDEGGSFGALCKSVPSKRAAYALLASLACDGPGNADRMQFLLDTIAQVCNCMLFARVSAARNGKQVYLNLTCVLVSVRSRGMAGLRALNQASGATIRQLSKSFRVSTQAL